MELKKQQKNKKRFKKTDGYAYKTRNKDKTAKQSGYP